MTRVHITVQIEYEDGVKGMPYMTEVVTIRDPKYVLDWIQDLAIRLRREAQEPRP